MILAQEETKGNMKLSEYRKASNEYTAKTSEITRQLSLAGIAIIWLFKNADDKQSLANTTEPLLNRYLIIPLIFLSAALLADLLQYVIGGETWINFFKKKEKELADPHDNPEIEAPKRLSRPIYMLLCKSSFHAVFILLYHLFNK
ncbi:MAG: hypothetical protein ICV53_17925 [Flavisolibacter sp.]|nr:hypothetical protein [Flavisolibacter sp.]